MQQRKIKDQDLIDDLKVKQKAREKGKSLFARFVFVVKMFFQVVDDRLEEVVETLSSFDMSVIVNTMTSCTQNLPGIRASAIVGAWLGPQVLCFLFRLWSSFSRFSAHS